MRLDPALLRDVLQVDEDGEMPVTAEQWLRLPAAANATAGEIQKAYQSQVERLKTARGNFDMAQLRYASQQIRQAAIELKGDIPAKTTSNRSVDSSGPARQSSPQQPPIAKPLTEPQVKPPALPLGKPLAKPLVATPVAKPLNSATVAAPVVVAPVVDAPVVPKVTVDTNAAPKKRSGRSLSSWIFLLGTVSLLVATGFALVQFKIIDLNQLAGRSVESDSPTENSPNGTKLPSGDSNAELTAVGEAKITTDNNSQRPPTVQNSPLVVSPNQNRPVNMDNSAADKLPKVSTGSSPDLKTPQKDPSAYDIRYSEVPILGWYHLANRFDAGLAALAVGDRGKVKQAIDSIRMSMEDWKAGAVPLGALLEKIDGAGQAFDAMLATRLPLLVKTGEIKVNGNPVAVITCEPNNYTFRIEGRNQRYNDKTLPLGLKLAMFNGVVPDVPFDDVCLHVFNCLPYLRGNSELKDSLLQRLDSTKTMSPGNMYDESTVDVLRSFVQANGSVSQWIASQAGPEMAQDRSELEATVQSHLANSESVQLSVENPTSAMLQAMSGLDESRAVSLRENLISEFAKLGDLPMCMDLLRDQLVWMEADSKQWSDSMFKSFGSSSKPAENVAEWLNEIEKQLRNSANDPALKDVLLNLGGQLASKFQKRRARQWKQRFDKAMKEGSSAASEKE